jgi:outer membrane protein assembly factor BamB
MPTDTTPQGQLPQWAMFGKNLRHTSNAADPVEYYAGPQQGKIVWTVDFGFSEECFTSPSIGPDRTIYMATTPIGVRADTVGFIYAIRSDGTIKWRFRTRKGNVSNGTVGLDGTYYIGSRDKFFYAIDKDGNLKWKREFPLASFQAQHPAITMQGEIIVPISQGIIALNEKTGETIWFYETVTTSGRGVSLDRNGNIYTSTISELLVLSSEGKKKWEFPISITPYEVVIAQDGTVFFTLLHDSLLYALNSDGSTKFTFNLKRSSLGHVPILTKDGSIVILNSYANLYRLDYRGQPLQTIDMRQLIREIGFVSDNNPIVDKEGTIYLSIARMGGGNFYAVSQDGTIKWSLTIENQSVVIYPTPAIAPDGTMYVAGYHSINAIR